MIWVSIHRVKEGQKRGVICIDGRHDRQVVLELVKVVGGCGDGVVERVEEGGVVRAEGELVDLVGEVEC